MSTGTKIEWTDATWNPVTGCTRVSAGCDRCYIERTPPFRMAGRRFDGTGPGSSTGVQLHPQRLEQPLRWRKPRRVFVNSLADLFHDDVPDDFLVRTFAVMATVKHCTFQILTKRPARMRSLLSDEDFADRVERAMAVWTHADTEAWPLPNVWLGVSVENQKWADIRIPALLNTPAAVRWISAEPLLGPIDLNGRIDPRVGGRPRLTYWLHGEPRFGERKPIPGSSLTVADLEIGPKLDWVVAGGESGPGSRPMHPDWARGLRDQCAQARVPFLFKQWGDHRPPADGDESGAPWTRVGKKAAGRELDGRTHDEYPEVTG